MPAVRITNHVGHLQSIACASPTVEMYVTLGLAIARLTLQNRPAADPANHRLVRFTVAHAGVEVSRRPDEGALGHLAGLGHGRRGCLMRFVS